MRKKQTEPVADVLMKVLGNHKLSEKLYETKVINAWPIVLGDHIMKYTKRIYFHRKTLYVELASSVLRSELTYSRPEIIKALNNHVGEEVVKEIVFK